jgi:protein SCO1/2
MKKSALIGILISTVLPFTGYYMVKIYSQDAVQMPRRYFYDSVVVTTKNGKLQSDTIWHKVRNIQLINQLGKRVTLDSLKGKIIVINFFFTKCPTICPGMARSMKKLQDSYANSKDSIVQFISISIDPERDSVLALRKFANKFTSNHDSWWLVTGDKKDIYDFALNEIKANVADVNADTAFPHTENFFLLDRNRVIRGWYNGFDSVEQSTLVRNIPMLMLEKKKKRSFSEFLKELFGRS